MDEGTQMIKLNLLQMIKIIDQILIALRLYSLILACTLYCSSSFAQMQQTASYEQVQRDPKKILDEINMDKIVQTCGQDRRCRIARLKDKLRMQRILEAKLEDAHLAKVIEFYEQRERKRYPRLSRTKSINYMIDANSSFESALTGFQLGYQLNEYWQIEGMMLFQGAPMYTDDSALYDNFIGGYQYRMGLTHLDSLETSTYYYGLSFAYMYMESEGYLIFSSPKQESLSHLIYLNYGYDWLFSSGFHFRLGTYLALPLYIGLRDQDSKVNADIAFKTAFASQLSSYYLGLGFCFQIGYSF
jgi:hypothetical protein